MTYTFEISTATNGYQFVGYLVMGTEREVAAYANDEKQLRHYMSWRCAELNEGGDKL